MRRLLLVVGVAAGALAVLEAQQTPPRQTPQTPTFRTDVDVIRLDVSVLDKDRRPVLGLTAADFTVSEDGKAQRIVAVSQIDAAERDPTPTAWMRHVPPDITTNDLVDQAGDGRIFTIVMDDVNIPWDDLNIIQAAREAGRYIVDSLGPSDIAAVVYPRDAGNTQDYTSDHQKLIDAIDRFDPREPDLFFPPRPPGPSGGGGDMPYRFSPALMRTECERRQPTVPTLSVIAGRLATVPNRRKTVILVSVGVPVNLAATQGCSYDLAQIMKDVFRIAQRANINIYGVDPAGYRGYEQYLMSPVRRGGRPAKATLSQPMAEGMARSRHEFLEITADYTGARAVVKQEPYDVGIDRIFEEDGFYYLIGYETTNGKPDGRFRRVQVKVNRPGVTVRTRSGYYAPRAGTTATREQKEAPTTNDLNMSGMGTPVGLPLRASVVPVGLAGTPGSRDADVAVVLSVKLPAVRNPVSETLTVVRNIYTDGKPGPPVQEKLPMRLEPGPGDELRYDVYQKLTLPPGRYEVRLNAHSTALDRNSSIYAEFEVPDFTRAPVVLSGIALGAKPSAATPRTDGLTALLPIVPTSAREFGPNEAVTGVLRVYQGGSSPVVPVTMRALVLNIADQTIHEATTALAADAFAQGRVASYEVDLPLGKMQHGPHLLSITATLANGNSVRRDLVFRVR